jgi:hypothetical protein
MGKRILILVILPMLVIALAGVSYGWQGRMGGMGDPYGLISDESDYLTHPAKIAKGEGVRFYGDYRFTYTGVTDWDNEVDIFSPAGVLGYVFPKEISGDEQRHEALLGSSFPLGPGRMGLFFTYQGMRGAYDGKLRAEYYPGPTYYYDTYDLNSDLDNFAFRLLYGLPVGGFKLGGEAQIAYRQEENKALCNKDFGGGSRGLFTNVPFDGIWGAAYYNTLPLMLPYDSRYWEALFKGSLEGKVGPLDLEFTLRGGFLFGGDNQYEYERQQPIGTPTQGFRLNGDVTGWRIGGDVWARYPLAKDLSLPFLVRIDYQTKTRDGDGPGLLGLTGDNFPYKSQEQSLHIEMGGGLDKELSKGAKIAGGIYYNYLQGKNALQIRWDHGGGEWYNYDSSDFPASTEHQVMLRLAGELELSPAVTLRMGLASFYGWVRQDFKFTYLQYTLFYNADDVSTDGYHWGIGASLGGTVKFKLITLEPFINGGYQQLHLKGDGGRVNPGGLSDLYEMSKDRNEWFIGGGFSILYNL